MVRRARTPRAVAIAAVALGVVVALALALAVRFGLSSGDLRGCAIGQWHAQCGWVAVPEDPADPDGKKIRLNVAVFRATGGHAKPDPLFWFSGWGGAGVSDDAANVVALLRRVNADRDLVFIDQRGTGSSKLACPLPPTSVAVTAAARRCAKRIGPRLRYYTSAIAVDDFDRVRKTLGYDKINLYGGSYGVTTGQIYLLRHGAHVRTAVFDSGSLLDVRIFERVAPNAQRALELLFRHCAADTSCRTAYPHLRAEFARIEGSAALASGLEELLASFTGKAIAPRVIHLVATGQLRRAERLVRPLIPTAEPLAYQLLIQCSEPWASWRPAPTARLARGTFMRAQQQRETQRARAVCKGFPRAAVSAAIGRRVHSRVPVLFLTGNEDPADPPANVAHARRELPNSRTVVWDTVSSGFCAPRT